MKKSMFMIFVILTLIPFAFVSSCSTDPQNETSTNNGGEKQENPEGDDDEPEDYFEARKKIPDNLPDTDFGGEDIKIMIHPTSGQFVLAEEILGEVVNDAVYEANLMVNERFNANLKLVEENEVTMIDVIKRAVQAGDNYFNIAFVHDFLGAPLAFDSFYANFYDMKHLDFDKPWWNKAALDELTVLGQCYMTSPSMTYMALARARVLLINEDKMADFGLDLPYDDVIAGTWTLDKLIALTKDTWQDLNGNGIADDEDFYGFFTEGSLYGYIDNFEIPIYGRDEYGLVSLATDAHKMSEFADKLYDWFFTSNDARIDSGDPNNLFCAEFANGQTLIQRGQLHESLPRLLGSDINYGILPMPKYDENQKDYMTQCGEFLCVVPSTMQGEDLDRLSIIMEAMCAEGYKMVFPAYFEIALQVKYFDAQSVQMLDIINESRRPSFSYIYDSGIGMLHTLYNLFTVGSPSKDFASFYERRIPQLQKTIEKMNDSYERMK